MEFTKKELSFFECEGRNICISSKALAKLISEICQENFKEYSLRSYYFWRNEKRPIPVKIAQKAMDIKKVNTIEVQNLSVSGGNCIFFPKDNLMEFHYFLGLILGDGCLVHTKKSNNRSSYHIQITFRTKKEAKKIKTISEYFFGIDSHIYPGEGCYNLCIYSKPLVILFNKRYEIPIGLKYSLIKVPQRVRDGEDYEITAFLKGVFDSDGNIYLHSGRKSVQLRQKSERFIRELRDLFVRIGINFNNPYYDRANNSWLLWSSKKELVDNFINRIIDLQINAPVAQPG